jgi:ribosomal protein L12E/L44/L45/RPP1/RPP2
LLDLQGISSAEVAINSSDLIKILTEEGESVSEENAKVYIKQLLGNTSQVFMDDLLKNYLKLTDGFNLNALM